MHASHERRLLDKLVREIVRCEAHALDHAPREERRIGQAPPVLVLRAIGDHAQAMRPRLQLALEAYALDATPRFGSRMTTLRARVVDRMIDAERAFRGALLDLRHGVDVVRVLRDVARREIMFSLIRWCDDWLAARRTLVARVEAQLGWFAETGHAVPAAIEAAPPAQACELAPPPGDVVEIPSAIVLAHRSHHPESGTARESVADQNHP